MLAFATTVGSPAAFPAEGSAELFARACASCHGKDGKAQTPIARKLKVKDLTQTALDEPAIAEQIRAGRKGEDGLTRMPSFGESLKPAEIEGLVQYVRTLQQRGKKKAPVRKPER